MVALRDFFPFGLGKNKSPKSTRESTYDFAQRVYRETNGATPELRKLMREYRERQRDGSVRVVNSHSLPTVRR